MNKLYKILCRVKDQSKISNYVCSNLKHICVHRKYSTNHCDMKVTIIGAAGCTGQPLSLMLKQCPLVDEIALYDMCATCGFGIELSHINTKCKVSSYSGKHMLCDALRGSKVVVILARDQQDSFENNAPIVTEIAIQICNSCPSAFTIVATEPVDSMVPLVSEIQRLRSTYNPRALLGCIELNCVRANTMLAHFLEVPPETIKVPVIGGATPYTMVPVLSKAINPNLLTAAQVECITASIMSGTDAVQKSKCCPHETPSLAGAYAIARTTINVVKGLKGTRNVQCAYVDSLGNCAPNCQFFASDVVLGPSGVEKNLGVPELSNFENCLLCHCLPYVRAEIDKAIWLVYTMCQQVCQVYCNPCSCHRTWHEPPCVPPAQWTCDWPDECRDKYLSKICREMTCRCGPTGLCWTPRQADYDAVRSANVTHQMPLKCMTCYTEKRKPRSIRYQEHKQHMKNQNENQEF